MIGSSTTSSTTSRITSRPTSSTTSLLSQADSPTDAKGIAQVRLWPEPEIKAAEPTGHTGQSAAFYGFRVQGITSACICGVRLA